MCSNVYPSFHHHLRYTVYNVYEILLGMFSVGCLLSVVYYILMYTVVITALVCIHVHAVSSLRVLLDTITTSRPCLGNPDPLFLRLPNIRNAVLKDHSTKYMFDIYAHVHITCISVYNLLTYRIKSSCSS